MPGTGIEPVRGKPPQDFKSCVSASSTTPACRKINHLRPFLLSRLGLGVQFPESTDLASRWIESVCTLLNQCKYTFNVIVGLECPR